MLKGPEIIYEVIDLGGGGKGGGESKASCHLGHVGKVRVWGPGKRGRLM